MPLLLLQVLLLIKTKNPENSGFQISTDQNHQISIVDKTLFILLTASALFIMAAFSSSFSL